MNTETINNRNRKCFIKLVVIGDSGVGKSSLINYFQKGFFSENFKPTIGADFANREIQFDTKRVFYKFGILLDKNDSKVSVRHFIGEPTVAVLFMMLQIRRVSTISKPGKTISCREHNPTISKKSLSCFSATRSI